MIGQHPIELFEKGVEYINNYHGETSSLTKAEKIFKELINKYPQLHYGYLGLSRVRIIEAYRHGQQYNMTLIYNEALPLANRALELGPSIREVYLHYENIEDIVARDLNQRNKAKAYVSLFLDEEIRVEAMVRKIGLFVHKPIT